MKVKRKNMMTKSEAKLEQSFGLNVMALGVGFGGREASRPEYEMCATESPAESSS